MSDRLSTILIWSAFGVFALAATGPGCASAPAEPNFKKFAFPKNAYIGDVQRPYTVLGPVRSKVDYQTLDFNREEKDLCRNYYNRAVRDLVKYAKKQGGDAVVDVKSVVFLVDGRTEMYATPECSDEGGDGQVLTQGVAVKWKGAPVESGAWTQPPARLSATPATPVAPVATSVASPAAAPGVAVLAAPSARNPSAPVFPEGGTLVPEQDEPVMPEARTDARTDTRMVPQPVAAGPPAAEKSRAIANTDAGDDAPVTATMEPYDPQKGLVSSPSTFTFPKQPVPAPTVPAAPAVQYAPGDPRYMPGSIQRTTTP